uniref:Uncharacterized protein n=1 Tax=Oryza brachyantha TaxID=4533 RepID=J3L312_ORYBR
MAATAVAGVGREASSQKRPRRVSVRMERSRAGVGDGCCCSCSGRTGVATTAFSGRAGMVVIVGATGTGKTKLSIDAAQELGGEVVNADKIQLYAGLDVTTNKVPLADRRAAEAATWERDVRGPALAAMRRFLGRPEFDFPAEGHLAARRQCHRGGMVVG